MTDFILTNKDRHFNNFGFLYDSAQRAFVAMAPIYDTGNSLFFEDEFIPRNKNLLEISGIHSFQQKETSMLEYVRNKELIDIEKLKDFPEEVNIMEQRRRSDTGHMLIGQSGL